MTKKRELILDAMQELMAEQSAQTVSVSDIAKKAGIGKGSIYYYFKSKEEILEAVIERGYSAAIERSEALVRSTDMGALEKMKIIFRACRESSLELTRQESGNFFERQQHALLHQQFTAVLVRKLKPILTDIMKQAIEEDIIHCDYPGEISEIVLIVLISMLDNQILPATKEEQKKSLNAFSWMLEQSLGLKEGELDYLITD